MLLSLLYLRVLCFYVMCGSTTAPLLSVQLSVQFPWLSSLSVYFVASSALSFRHESVCLGLFARISRNGNSLVAPPLPGY